MAQAVKKHKEVLDCLQEESAAKAALALELHKVEGERGAGVGGWWLGPWKEGCTASVEAELLSFHL